MTATRLELLLMQLFILIIALNTASASQCSDVAHAAVSELTTTGLTWIDCNAADGTCLPYGAYPNGTRITADAQCINIGTVKACGISGTGLSHRDFCGIYVGTTTPRFASVLSGTATSPIPIDLAAWHILANWPYLGYINDLATCCSTTTCFIAQQANISTDECGLGYSTIKCAGDEHHGVCNTWIGRGDSGQYFLVNADAPLPLLAAIVNSSSSESPTSPNPSSTVSTNQATVSPAAPSSRREETVPPWAIALICALGLAVLALSLLFARHVRVRRKIDRDQPAIDPASSGQPTIVPLITRPMGVSSDAQMMSGDDMALQQALSPPRYAKVAALY